MVSWSKLFSVYPYGLLALRRLCVGATAVNIHNFPCQFAKSITAYMFWPRDGVVLIYVQNFYVMLIMGQCQCQLPKRAHYFITAQYTM